MEDPNPRRPSSQKAGTLPAGLQEVWRLSGVCSMPLQEKPHSVVFLSRAGEACCTPENPWLDSYSEVRSARRVVSHQSHRPSLAARSTAAGRRLIAHVRPWRRVPKHCPAVTEIRDGMPSSMLHAPCAGRQAARRPRSSLRIREAVNGRRPGHACLLHVANAVWEGS